MNLGSIWTVSDEVVARKVADETVLLHLNSGTYFSLDQIGGRVWEILDQTNDMTLKQVCDKIFNEYDVKREVLERDIVLLVTELEAGNLISVIAS